MIKLTKKILVLFTITLLLLSLVSAGTVTRSFNPSTISSGGSSTVTLQVVLGAGETYYSLEDNYPSGWTVSAISSDDCSDQNARVACVKFMNAQPVFYTYTVTSPAGVTEGVFSGTYMFEGGIQTDIAGKNKITIAQPESVCNDNQDNDGDGLIDCADADCAGKNGPNNKACCVSDASCPTQRPVCDLTSKECGVEENEYPDTPCSDTLDNDGDGLVDCADNSCVTDAACVCTDECTIGEKQCVQEGVTPGKYQECGDYNNDGCNEFGGVAKYCGFNEACQAGVCACQPNCEGKVCGDDGCGGSCGSCPQGKVCNDAGQCACEDLCAAAGNKKCVANQVQTCGDYNNDGCLEWGQSTPCPSGTVCQIGNCVSPAECTAPACNPANLNQYCLNGLWRDCDAGQTCESGKCKEVHLVGDLEKDNVVDEQDVQWIKDNKKTFWEDIVKKSFQELNNFIQQMIANWGGS